MCGRTVVDDPRAIASYFDATWDEGALLPRYNVAPSQPVLVLRTPHRLELLRWGIHRRDRKPLQINMRVESIARTASRQRRCVVPVNGFYEWRDGDRQPFVIREATGHPIALGAIWSTSTTKDGEVIESVCVLTCPPRPPIAAIHDRMPLTIPREALERWLRPGADVSDLLTPRESHFVAAPVSSYVNSPKNDDPRCIAPPEGGDRGSS